ncbi:hypothetical protein SALBM217S_06797 [Streptomyces griseoloalbus]
MSDATTTDLYEVTMAMSYLREGMTGPATFSLFVRDLPAERGFLVAAGLESALDHLSGLHVGPEDVDAFASALHRPPSDLRPLLDLKFTGDVRAVPEGRIVLAGEPLLEVTAPLPQAQLAETYVLNKLSQTAVASKAARCVLAAAGRPVVDFSLRRTHGPQAGFQAARLGAMTGFAGTSNVAAATALGLTAVGTMAHSFVEAFATEEDAFRAFARSHPGPVTLLVDTYDTEEGVRVAARVLRELDHAARGPGSAVRLDSGDLGALAVRARSLERWDCRASSVRYARCSATETTPSTLRHSRSMTGIRPTLDRAPEIDPPVAHLGRRLRGSQPHRAAQHIPGGVVADGVVAAQEDPQQVATVDDAQSRSVSSRRAAAWRAGPPSGGRPPPHSTPDVRTRREPTSVPRRGNPRPWPAPTPPGAERGPCPTGRPGQSSCAAGPPRTPRPWGGPGRPPRARR